MEAVLLARAQLLHTVHLYLSPHQHHHHHHPVNLVYTSSRTLPHSILPDFKNSQGCDWLRVASLKLWKPLLLRGSECVTQDNSVHCDSVRGSLCFWISVGAEEWDVLCNQLSHKKAEHTGVSAWRSVCVCGEEGMLWSIASLTIINSDFSGFHYCSRLPALESLDGFANVVCLKKSKVTGLIIVTMRQVWIRRLQTAGCLLEIGLMLPSVIERKCNWRHNELQMWRMNLSVTLCLFPQARNKPIDSYIIIQRLFLCLILLCYI